MLAILEPYLDKYKRPIYIAMAALLILTAGFREIGFDPDSENYEYDYRNYFSNRSEGAVEFSYLWISQLLNNISSDVHAIFLFYALFSILFHFIAYKRLSSLWFLTIAVYVGFFYEMHELTQIRTGLLSGFFLLAIKPLCEGRRLLALSLILAGTCFHVSGFMLLPVLFLSNKEMTVKSRYFWAAVPIIGYFLYFAGSFTLAQLDIPFIGEKLLTYQEAEEKGKAIATVNVFGALRLFRLFIYYYLLIFYNIISSENKYVPILLKLYAIGIAAYSALAPVLGVLADRVGYQFQLVEVLLIPMIVYTIRPRWAATLIVLFISFIMFIYIMPYIFGVTILFNGG